MDWGITAFARPPPNIGSIHSLVPSSFAFLSTLSTIRATWLQALAPAISWGLYTLSGVLAFSSKGGRKLDQHLHPTRSRRLILPIQSSHRHGPSYYIGRVGFHGLIQGENGPLLGGGDEFERLGAFVEYGHVDFGESSIVSAAGGCGGVDAGVVGSGDDSTSIGVGIRS
eukprot:CCRYP_006979-RD/>CCRYP_006979-RD protein AED:0.48 eAED:0.80 QI:0/0/0/1/0/0/2/0/168